MYNVTITSNLNDFQSERRFAANTTVGELKQKLELITGAAPTSMKLELRTKDAKPLASLDDDTRTLQKFNVQDGMIVHVTDIVPAAQMTDAVGSAGGNVPKYEMSNDAYDKRDDSVRAWKQRNQLGEFDVNKQEQAVVKSHKAAQKIKIGLRCEVRLATGAQKRGTVAYVGETHFKPGMWAGVRYDEPVGKNDGSVGGKRYFQCPSPYGAFVRPQDVVVGDFPELSIDDGVDEI